MSVNGEHNQPRSKKLYRLFRFTAFFIVSISILSWFLILKVTEAQISQRLAVLRLDESAKHELQLEKEQLANEIYAQDQIERGKLKRIKKACSLFNSLSSFPVRGGDHIVLYESMMPSGIRLLFFVPAGRHKLRFSLGEQNMVGEGVHARSVGFAEPFEPGSNLKRSEVGTSISQSLDLPAASVLQFTFRLENDEHNCLVSVKLQDENRVLFRESYKYPKRTLSGTFMGSSAGEDIFRPGQIGGHGGVDRYRSQIFKMSPDAKSTRALKFYYQIVSPESRIFLRSNDVNSQLRKRANNGGDFESLFEEDDGTGRLFKKPNWF